MIDPEAADPLIAMRKRETVRGFLMRKKRRIKIQPQATRPGPRNPLAEMPRSQRIAIHALPICLGIARVQIQAVLSGNQRKGFVDVRPQFNRRTRFAGMVAGDGQPASEFDAGVLKSADVIALPTVQRDRHLRQRGHRRVDVHAQRRIIFLREFKRVFDVSRSICHA